MNRSGQSVTEVLKHNDADTKKAVQPPREASPHGASASVQCRTIQITCLGANTYPSRRLHRLRIPSKSLCLRNHTIPVALLLFPC